MDLRIELDDPRPPSQQIVDAILDAVATGELGARDRLPSVRGLAATALVNPNTVGRAYRELEVLGIVRGQSGKGVFVCAGARERCSERRSEATLESLRRAVQACRKAGLDVRRITQEVQAALEALSQPEGLAALDGESPLDPLPSREPLPLPEHAPASGTELRP